MQASASAAAAALKECVTLTQPGVQEYQLAATFGELFVASIIASVKARHDTVSRLYGHTMINTGLSLAMYSASIA